jgi:hypothetical protein
MCNHLNLKILIHIFTIIYLIIIMMRGENFVAHLDGLGGTPVCCGTAVAQTISHSDFIPQFLNKFQDGLTPYFREGKGRGETLRCLTLRRVFVKRSARAPRSGCRPGPPRLPCNLGPSWGFASNPAFRCTIVRLTFMDYLIKIYITITFPVQLLTLSEEHEVVREESAGKSIWT